ncbi:MAG: molybdenum cofactor guanylyltransferase, partial [Flavobacteriia bacterium]
MKKHKKHAKLERRNLGEHAPNEIAFVGTKCSEISTLVSEISKKIQPETKIAYLDASHSKDITASEYDVFTFHQSSGTLSLKNRLKADKYNNKILFNAYDLLFINGNHYQGDQQILVLDADKEASVLKRIDQLNNVQFIIKLTDKVDIFSFLIEKYPLLKDLPVYFASETEKITRHIEQIITKKIPPVKGLVLAGGKSVRMGSDKGLLDYHGNSQRDFAIEMMEKMGLKTFLSVRKEQHIERENVIEDVFLGLGPFGAICSAFQKDPNSAWLVLATDLPFIDQESLKLLLEKRNPSKIATAFKGKNKQFPEPLITIWEPKAYQRMLNFLAQGISCPRKVLINSEVEIVEIDDDLITNVNTPEEFQEVK